MIPDAAGRPVRLPGRNKLFEPETAAHVKRLALFVRRHPHLIKVAGRDPAVLCGVTGRSL